MKARLLRLFGLLAILILGLVQSGSISVAQQGGASGLSDKPIEPTALDQFGVNMAVAANPLGLMPKSHLPELTLGHTISIGTPNSGMSYTLAYSSGGQGWSPNNGLDGWISGANEVQETGVIIVNDRGKSELIESWVGDRGSETFGATGYCEIHKRDGTIVHFEDVHCDTNSPTRGRIKYILKRSGERLDYYYDPTAHPHDRHTHIRSVTSNLGYQLRFHYQRDYLGRLVSGSATLFNMRVDPCSPQASSCPTLSQNWPKLSWTYDPITPTISSFLLRITSVTDSGGGTTNYNYVQFDRHMPVISERIDAGGSTTSYSWSAVGCGNPSGCHRTGWIPGLTSLTNSAGTWSYSRDLDPNSPSYFGLVQTAPDGSTQAWNARYGHRNVRLLVTRYTDGLGRSTDYEYIYDNIYEIEYPDGNKEQFEYEVVSNSVNLIKRIPKPGSNLPVDTINIEYLRDKTGDCPLYWPCDRPVLIRNSRGFVSRYTWSTATGDLLTAEFGLSGSNDQLYCALGPGKCPLTTYTYANLSAVFPTHQGGAPVSASPVSMLISQTDCINTAPCGSGDSVVRSIGYGPQSSPNNLLPLSTTVSGPGVNATTTSEYDPVGNMTRSDGPRTDVSDISTTYWDSLRRPVLVFGPDPDGSGPRLAIAQMKTYDILGNLVTERTGTVTDSNGSGFVAHLTVQHQYDPRGLRIRTTTPSGVVQFSYDAKGRLVCTAQRMNPAVFGSLHNDACQQSAGAGFGPDRISRNLYDAADQVTGEQRGLGTPLFQTYKTIGYTPNGKVAWVSDANNNRTDFTYDGFDRVIRTSFPSLAVGTGSSNGNDYEAYQYDQAGNRTEVRKRDAQRVRYAFDALNREVSRDYDGPTHDVYTSYDLLSRKTAAQFDYPGGPGLGFAYDGLGNVVSESSFGLTLTSTYNAAGSRIGLTFPDGNTINYTYDAAGLPHEIRENGAMAGLGRLIGYSYDSAGRLAAMSRGNNTTTVYGYDSASRLVSHQTDLAGTGHDMVQSLAYNPVNQVTNLTRSNPAYRWATTDFTHAYSRDGHNRIGTVAGAAFQHDPRGNTTSDAVRGFTYDLENRLISGSGSISLAVEYDPNGRLLQTSTGGVVTRYLYDGDQLVAEYVAGGLARRYVHGPGLDDPLVWYEGSGLGDRRWFVADHQGSIIAVCDAAGAIMGAPMSYGPYGEPDVVTGWGGARFRYTGQATLPGAQLYHYKARAYNPRIGRFMQTDPIGYQDQMNLYAYVGNDPINAVDPTGLECVEQNGGSALCDPPGDDIGTFTIPAEHNPGYIGPNEEGYHLYTARASTPSSGKVGESITQAVIDNPTPGNDSPATAAGVKNDAGISPFPNTDNVISYVTRDSNGNTVVVNVTIPGQHILNPGYVAQAIVPGDHSTTVFVVGEGNAFIQQGPGSALGGAVFRQKIEGDIRLGIYNSTRGARP